MDLFTVNDNTFDVVRSSDRLETSRDPLLLRPRLPGPHHIHMVVAANTNQVGAVVPADRFVLDWAKIRKLEAQDRGQSVDTEHVRSCLEKRHVERGTVPGGDNASFAVRVRQPGCKVGKHRRFTGRVEHDGFVCAPQRNGSNAPESRVEAKTARRVGFNVERVGGALVHDRCPSR